MFCKTCGKEIIKESSFCGSCGTRIGNQLIRATFYSEDWTRKKVFAIASLPYFDVMTDDDFVYFIEMPRYKSSTIGLLIGLVLFNIIGAFIGSMIGSSSDSDKRKEYRKAWLNQDFIISNVFEKDVFLKIPLEEAKKILKLEKHRITYFNGKEKVVFQKNKQEIERLNNLLY